MVLLLVMLFMFCVGCDSSLFEDDDLEDSLKQELSQTVLSMDGVKVLSKVGGYDFASAVGKYSEHFYNLYAHEITLQLYNIYENPQNVYVGERDVRELLLNNLDSANGYTYPVESTIDENLYYLYDSLRYTISQVDTTIAKGGETIENQVLTLDLNSKWNWTIYPDVKSNDSTKKYATFFDNLGTIVTKDQNKITIRNVYTETINDWTLLYNSYQSQIPSFSEFYVGEDIKKSDTISNYFTSPSEMYGASGVNYFQDALEYAVYLIALEFNFDEYADYYNFNIVYGTEPANYGQVTDIKVGGWESAPISISGGQNSALARAKALYKENGQFVGLTQENRDMLVEFIENEVIGENAMAKDKFTVTQRTFKYDASGNLQGGPTSSSKQNFNRNYHAIVKNIVDYACEQAPIGEDENGDKVTLDSPYLTSEITDYYGNGFFVSYEGNRDDNLFKYIPQNEYQSIVIYPKEEDVGKTLGQLDLLFEYWDDPNDIISGHSNKVKLPQIVIDVGFRAFNHTTGQFYNSPIVTVTVKNQQFPYNNKAADYVATYEEQLVDFSDTGSGVDAAFGKGVTLSKFNQNIGGGVINPYANGMEFDPLTGRIKSKSITFSGIGGSRKASQYYHLLQSENGGTYGVLNHEMFTDALAGVGQGCDYIEVFFDVHKGSDANADYRFKVGFSSYMAGGSAVPDFNDDFFSGGSDFNDDYFSKQPDNDYFSGGSDFNDDYFSSPPDNDDYNPFK